MCWPTAGSWRACSTCTDRLPEPQDADRYHRGMSNAFGAEWSAGLRRADPADLAEWLAFAHECCDVADAIALASFRRELQVDTKADGSFVTEADRAIEQELRTRIADRFPGHGIVGEEYGTASGQASTRWYLDPIDGTHNFMRGVPLFGTLFAVERDGELQAGVVSAPALGQRWWASRGAGAWTSGGPGERLRRLRVSDRSDLAASQVLFRSVNDMHASRVSAGFDALLPDVWRDRGFGDFWGYMLVSDGAAEAMMEQALGAWDLAAPWIIVEEAGGRITDFDGARSLEKGEALATNGLVHDTLLDRLWSGRHDAP
jgi:histidinol-phosphatase